MSFWAPSRVMSLCFFARLAIAFPGVLEPEPVFPLPEGCSDMGARMSWFGWRRRGRVWQTGESWRA